MKLKRIMAVILTVSMVLSLGGVSILAETDKTDADLTISTVEELFVFAEKVNDGTYKNVDVVLTDNIDLTEVEEDWVSIGTRSNPFTGTFDGQNNKIIGLWSMDNGLFGFTSTGNIADGYGDKAVIKNLTMENVEVYNQSTSAVGGVVGQADRSTSVENVTLTGTIQIHGYGYVGGIVGQGYVKINNCHVNGISKDESMINAAYWAVGGILGHGGGSSENGLSITNCSVKNVSINSAYYGAASILGQGGGTVRDVSAENVKIIAGSEPEYNGILSADAPVTGDSVASGVTLVVAGNQADGQDMCACVGNTYYTSLATALAAANAETEDVTVEILKDINLSGIDWTPIAVNNAGAITVNGNGKTITGLSDMLFSGFWGGTSGLIINDLTIADSYIVHDKDDSKGNVGVGAFIGSPGAADATLNNCHLINSTVEGGHWTGGLVGTADGYDGSDGPVFMTLTIKNCSVKKSEVISKGSAGGLMGHASRNLWTLIVVEDTVVEDNTITSTGSSTNKAGSLFGTIGAAGAPSTANGVTKTGGHLVDAIVSGNTVTSNGTTITTIYGRQGTPTGILELTGGTYDSCPILESDTWATAAEGFVVAKNADGTYSVGAMPEPIVTNLGAITVEDYDIWDGSLKDGGDPIDLQVAMNFTASDTKEEAAANVFADYLTDFYIEIAGTATGSFDATGCYLAGDYDPFGWIMIPLDGMTIEEGVAYPVISNMFDNFTYETICSSVKSFNCGIYFSKAVVEENPNMTVSLTLGLSEDIEKARAAEYIPVEEPYTYAVKDFGKVAEVDGVQHTTLGEAMEAAKSGKTVKLIADIALTAPITVASGDILTIDLNGHKLTYESTVQGEAMITNNGTLTIADATDSGLIKYTYTGEADSTYGKGNYTINNYGTLEIAGGTVQNATAKMSHAYYTITNYDASLTVSGGDVVCDTNRAIRLFGGGNDMTITDGTVTGTMAVYLQSPGDDAETAPEITLNIKGGKLVATDATYDIAVYSYSYGNSLENVVINVSDGELDGDIALAGGKNKTASEKVTITGGTFTGTYGGVYSYAEDTVAAPAISITGGTFPSDAAEIYAEDDGYEFVANEDGTYGVAEVEEEETKLNTKIYFLHRDTTQTSPIDQNPAYRTRVYAGVDSLKYESVGFEYRLLKTTLPQLSSNTNIVYSSLTAKVGNETLKFVPSQFKDDTAGADLSHIFALNIYVPESYGGYQLEVRAYAENADGEKIYSDWYKAPCYANGTEIQ